MDLREFGVRVGGALLLFGAGLPVLADDLSPLRVSTLLGEPRRAVLLFESDELNPPDLTLTHSLGDASARISGSLRSATTGCGDGSGPSPSSTSA